MNRNTDPSVTGQRLVSDFQSVLLSQSTAQAALHEAERSESELIQQLTAASRGTFLQPSALSSAGGDSVVRASLDAHIKKVQAQQLKSMSSAQLAGQATEDKIAFVGHKVRITKRGDGFQPFDVVWYDHQTGYRSNEFKKTVVEGEIEEIVFEKNLLVIKPKRISRIINSNLQHYLVYVIDPATFSPAVEIEVL